jgi:hypothetical protein
LFPFLFLGGLFALLAVLGLSFGLFLLVVVLGGFLVELQKCTVWFVCVFLPKDASGSFPPLLEGSFKGGG